MRAPSFADSYEVLCLQAADQGRAEVLFGDSLPRARTQMRPFMVGEEFPSVYLEFPLMGAPSLDVTVLYGRVKPGTRVDSDAASGNEALFDWFAGACEELDDVSFGFELDTSRRPLPQAAVHFQPRRHRELVRPFCELIGEPERAELYLDFADRMPDGWDPSFFGMFRGRPNSPLRVCGYLGGSETRACTSDAGYLPAVFDAIGFDAYDDAMLDQVRQIMAAAPDVLDYQFDIWPDGHLGSTFALDVQFGIKQPEAVIESFARGSSSKVMPLLESWGIADGRWRLGVEAAFAKALPVDREGREGRFSFTLMPQWAKVRWTDGKLQPSKLYLLGKAGFIDS